MADIPFQLADPLAERLRAVIDVEGKIIRALESLGPLAERDVALVDVPAGPLLDRLTAAGIEGLAVPIGETFRLDVPDASLDAVVSLWSGFRGVDPAALAEVDRALRPDGCLLVVHDYGHDDICGLGEPDAPEYRSWSRREGPFLSGGGFKVRVVHCFWTFPSIEEAQSFLGEAFGERGAAIGETLRRPRLSWNVAIYHRRREAAEAIA
jgi:SAM-dependent methyltransferase